MLENRCRGIDICSVCYVTLYIRAPHYKYCSQVSKVLCVLPAYEASINCVCRLTLAMQYIYRSRLSLHGEKNAFQMDMAHNHFIIAFN